MDFVLRQACPDDLDAVMNLEEAGFPLGVVEERAVFADRLEVFPEGFFLAETSGTPMGYLCAEVWAGWGDRDVPDPRRFDLGHDLTRWLDRAGDTAYIASMTVGPRFRGNGLGRRLFRGGLERLAAGFPQVRRVVLIVNEHWSVARRIYEAEGFSEVGCLPGFFRPLGGPVGDAVVMKKETGRS